MGQHAKYPSTLACRRHVDTEELVATCFSIRCPNTTRTLVSGGAATLCEALIVSAIRLAPATKVNLDAVLILRPIAELMLLAIDAVAPWATAVAIANWP